MASVTVNDLLRLLQDRGLTLERDDVQWAFESPHDKEELNAWLKEYSSPATLLSLDEAKLYKILSRHGILPRQTGGSITSDDELLVAIESLENSTSAIEKHQKILGGQRAALRELTTLKTKVEEEEEVQDDRLNGHESGRLHISVEETIDAINEDASSTKNAVNSAIRSLATYASERLASDDQTLDTISKFDLQTSYAPPKTDTKAIENWCQQLVSFRTSQTKARMEVIYRSALAEAAEGNVDTMPETELLQEKEALESELHTLREEIASVAGMVIENELRKPIVTAMERSESERVRSRREWLDYISFSFGYIIARLDSLELCASELTAFRAALNEIERAFEQNRRGDDPENIASSRAKEKHVNTGRTDAPRLVRKGSAPVEEDELPRLLRTLDLELPRNTNQTPDSYIASKLASRSARLQAQLSAAELSTLQTLGEYLQFQDSNVQAALNALYANTPYGSKCLSNPLLGAEVEHLESVISDAGSSISAVEGRQGEAELVGLRNIRTKWNR